jgi:DNA-binding beta-propeller fold protein YncE
VGGTVTVIDLSTNGLVAAIPLDLAPRGIAAGPDAMWVACGRNALVRIDPDPLTRLSRSSFRACRASPSPAQTYG